MRFNGFDEDWVSYKIGDISKTYSGGTPSTSKREYYNGNIPFIKSGEIGNEVTEQYINEEAINNSSAKKVQKGDLLLALYGATSGEVAISKIDGAINQAVLKIDNKMNNYFQYNYFVKYKDQIIHKYLQGGQGNLSANIIKKLEFYYPNLEEQQKISNYLLLIDNKIELLEKKHHEYQNFKKYLMQQIFAQKLRFADDENWVTVTIANIFDNITDYVAAGSFADIRKNVTYLKDPDYAQLIRTADLKSNFTNGDFVYVDKHAFEYLWRVNLDEPCIVLPNIGNIGEVYYINPKELPYSNNALAPNAILLKSNDNIKFKYYLLESPYFKNQLDIINEAGGRGKFNKTNLKKIKIKVPNNDLEKEKIAKCLSNVDNKLKLFNIQLIEMQEFKKGLLQQMFV